MLAKTLEGLFGLLLAWSTLRDVFDTVVVPGRARGALRISRRMVFAALPLWKGVQRRGIGLNFAPLMLLATFLTWMALLILAFALMAHALGGWFVPRLEDFSEAIYIAGSAMTTIGFGSKEPYGPAAAVAVGAGFCGLAVMTMAVTYLLEVQSNIAIRDTGVLKITTAAGHPPSALGLLERYAALDSVDELDDILRGARDWCAAVLQSHASHPSLIYFRSASIGAGWPAALGAVMDLALITEWLVDEPRRRGLAVLVREEAERLAREMTCLLRLEPIPLDTVPSDVQALCDRLRGAGYRLRAGADFAAFIAARQERIGCIEALSRHLGTDAAPLLP